jgi:hypothetical protein
MCKIPVVLPPVFGGRLALAAPGYNPEARILDLTAGSDLRLNINLEPAEVTAPPLPTAPKPPPPPATAPKPPPAPKLPAPPREPREGTRPRTAVLLTGFAAACGDRSGEVLFYCDEWDNCADLPTTICSDRGICVCPNYNDIFCGEKCVPYEVCYPPPECNTDDAGAPDGG